MPKLSNPDGGKKYPLNMRTTAELRAQIQNSARSSGRSLVQEVEARLERTFIEDRERARPKNPNYSGYEFLSPSAPDMQSNWATNWAGSQGQNNGDILSGALSNLATNQMQSMAAAFQKPKSGENA